MIHQNALHVEVEVKASISTAWETWVTPEHIVHWNFASTDWCCPTAVNDLKIGGKFCYRMESVDGKQGFDFAGTYTDIKTNELIEYSITGGRKVSIIFTNISGNETKVEEYFEPETVYSLDKQREGWSSILNNFKQYTENRPFEQ